MNTFSLVLDLPSRCLFNEETRGFTIATSCNFSLGQQTTLCHQSQCVHFVQNVVGLKAVPALCQWRQNLEMRATLQEKTEHGKDNSKVAVAQKKLYFQVCKNSESGWICVFWYSRGPSLWASVMTENMHQFTWLFHARSLIPASWSHCMRTDANSNALQTITGLHQIISIALRVPNTSGRNTEPVKQRLIDDVLLDFGISAIRLSKQFRHHQYWPSELPLCRHNTQSPVFVFVLATKAQNLNQRWFGRANSIYSFEAWTEISHFEQILLEHFHFVGVWSDSRKAALRWIWEDAWCVRN